jgi:copper transport protein
LFGRKPAPRRQVVGRHGLRLLAVIVAATVVLALTAPAAWGHAAFLESQPEAGTRVEAGPSQITLGFTEPLNEGLSEATLVNVKTGETVPSSLVEGDDRELILQPQARLERAPYRVDWHTVSTVDGHALEGSFGFGVQTAAAEAEHELEQSPLARDGWLRIAARAAFYAALIFFAGGVFAGALLSRRRPTEWILPRGLRSRLERRGEDGDALAERAARRTIDAGWLAASGAATVAILEAGDAGGGLGLAGLSDFLFTNVAGLARVGAVVAILLAVVSARRMPLAASGWIALAFLSIALGGHANSAEQRGLAVFTDWVHLLAAAVWVGGIAQIAVAWLPLVRLGDRELRQEGVRSVLPRFGRVALPAFLVVAATGLTNALIQLGHVEALWQTPYGRILGVKIAFVGSIALASYLHAVRLRPRLSAANPHPEGRSERAHWRLLFSEPLLAVGAIAAVATLVAFPLPPQQLGETDEAEAATPCDPCPLPDARPDQLAVAEQAGSRIAAFWLRREGDGVAGTLRLLDRNARPVDAPVDLPGGELEECGTGCWRLNAPVAARALSVLVEEGGRDFRAAVPTRWDAGRNTVSRQTLARMQSRMRALRSVRLDEDITSGPGSFVRTRYRFRAPDRMTYQTSSGARSVVIGPTAYRASDGGEFEREPFGAGPFRLDSFFRWTAYAQAVRWLGVDEAGGRTEVELAVFDPATPLWYRLAIDRRSGRLTDERMIAPAHYMDRRYFAFDRPLRIEAPR